MKIAISNKVMDKMFEYAAWANHHFGTEIAGWGHFSEENGIYKLAPLPKQTVKGAEVDSFPTEITNDVNYDISDMTVQWHSHVEMGVNPSYTDKQFIKDALEIMPYLISIIVNVKGEYSAEINIIESSGVRFDEPLSSKVELVKYYSNQKISDEVKQQCTKYEPPPTQQPQMPVRQYDYRNYEYGSYGSYGSEQYLQEFQPKRISAGEFWKNIQKQKLNGKLSPRYTEVLTKILKLQNDVPDINVDYEDSGRVFVHHVRKMSYAELFTNGSVKVNGSLSTWETYLATIGYDDKKKM